MISQVCQAFTVLVGNIQLDSSYWPIHQHERIIYPKFIKIDTKEGKICVHRNNEMDISYTFNIYFGNTNLLQEA